ncbi:MAG TPA: response regulator [Bryobacteraceae bacterium]|jgi:CheY-like chemotaxis protein/anti-sigma regulatory factor (Ser/Thr protein kinase)
MDNHKRILLVDDDAGILELLTASLRNAGQIETATSAEDALDCLERTAFDVVVTDLKMPGMGGLELLRRVGRIRPNARVIVMTADSGPDTVTESLRNHAFTYLSKPFSITVLQDAIQQALVSDNEGDDIRILSAKPTWVSLSLRCKMEIADRILNFLRAMDVDLTHEEQDRIATAFRELLINAIEHGGHSDPEKRVDLTYIRTAGAIIYYLHDPGEGFSFERIPHAAISNDPDDPVAHTEIRDQMGIRPGGFGLLLTRNVADELIYSEKGNEVMLVKYLKGRPGLRSLEPE